MKYQLAVNHGTTCMGELIKMPFLIQEIPMVRVEYRANAGRFCEATKKYEPKGDQRKTFKFNLHQQIYTIDFLNKTSETYHILKGKD